MNTLGYHDPLIPVTAMALIIPLAGYFLVLGLLNSRRRPQLLRASEDALLLLGTLSLLFAAPLSGWVGLPGVVGLYAALACGGLCWLRLSRSRSWVVYNLATSEARRAVARALEQLSVAYEASDGRFALQDGLAVQVEAVPLFRNSVIRWIGPRGTMAQQFESALSQSLRDLRAEPSPAASACVLLATAMLVLPMTLAADRAVEIVRIITDILP